ncbi:uracil-DNA glycosylase [Roseateles sp.]|uniref:uracil-DNA glycosylase n=1 Tax=Roseateles sp. TaxID=1971397 RepID=UPI003BA7C7F2
MSWDDRQRSMLAAMGLRVWTRLEELDLSPDLQVESLETAEIAATPDTPAPSSAASAPPAKQAMQALPAELLRAAPAQPASPVVRALVNGDQRVSAIAGMDWLTLRHSVGDCRACYLCEGRRSAGDAVLGRGQAKAPWLVVGDMPGEAELAQGQAFAGQSGQLLNNMLRALGLDAEESAGQVSMLNALKCGATAGRSPGAQELAQCEPYLQRQIELLQPRVILALGRMAVQSLLHTQEALGRLRGQVHRYQGIPVIVSFPLSYLLRNPAEKARAWEDLCLARQQLSNTRTEA